MTKYEHVVTIVGKRRTRDDVNNDPVLEFILEDDLFDHQISLDYHKWNHLNIGDGLKITVEDEY